MSQINVNQPSPGGYEPVDDSSGDRSAAAGINLITVLVVLVVLAILAWWLFTGPLHSLSSGGSTTNVNVQSNPQPAPTVNVNVNPPAPNVNVNPPSGGNSNGSSNQPSNPAPRQP